MKKDFSSAMDVHLYVREQSFVHMAISGDDYDIVATYTPTHHMSMWNKMRFLWFPSIKDDNFTTN